MKQEIEQNIQIPNENTQNTSVNQEIISVDNKSDNTDILISKYTKDGQKVYKVLKYAYTCEEHNKIAFLIPLVRTKGKLAIFIILNIFTVGIINLFVAWFPKLVLYIYYSITDLETATHLGIFSKEDKDFEVVKKNVIDLPPIDYDSKLSIVKKFNLNIDHGATRITIFEY